MVEAVNQVSNYLISPLEKGQPITPDIAAEAALKAVYNLEHGDKDKPFEKLFIVQELYKLMDLCREQGIFPGEISAVIKGEVTTKRIPFPKAERKTGYEALEQQQKDHGRVASFLVAAFYEPDNRL